MSRVPSTALTAQALLLGLALVRGAEAQTAAYVREPRPLGPLTAMSAEEQTRLALSTAPEEVVSRASVYVLTPRGYVQARAGSNGFSCLVERERLETVEPVCYDAEGTATTLPARFYREELRAQGLSEDEVMRRVARGYQSGRFHAPRKPGLVYMLARENWTWNPATEGFSTAPPHFMLYAPYAKQEDVGGAPGSHTPFVLWAGQPDALLIIIAQDSSHH